MSRPDKRIHLVGGTEEQLWHIRQIFQYRPGFTLTPDETEPLHARIRVHTEGVKVQTVDWWQETGEWDFVFFGKDFGERLLESVKKRTARKRGPCAKPESQRKQSAKAAAHAELRRSA